MQKTDRAASLWFNLLSWLSTPRTRIWRFVSVILVWMLYPLTYKLMLPLTGHAVSALGAIPPLVMGFLFGRWGGVLGMGIAFGVNTLLFTDSEPLSHAVRSRLPGYIILAFAMILVVGLRESLLRLQAAERSFRTIFEAIPDVLFLVDQDGRIVRVNEAVQDVLGYKPEELIGRSIEVLVPPEQRKIHQKERAIYQAAPQRRPMGTGLELYAVTKDGRRVPVDIGLAPVDLPDGSYTIAGMRDISRHKEAETRIRRAEERYHRLFDIMPVMAVLTYDRGGEPIITDCNEAFLSLGYTRDEVIGRSLADFYTPESQQALHDGGYQSALTTGLFGVERQLKARDGRVLDTLLFVVPERDATGRVLGTLALFVDITERKRLEASLRRREQELAALARVLSVALKTTDMDFMLNEVLHEAMAFTSAEMGAVFLHQREAYVLRVWENMPDDLRATLLQVPVDENNDWWRDFRVVREPLSKTGRISNAAKQVGIQATIFLPLRSPVAGSEAPPIAVLMLAARDINAFTDEQVAALRVMADQMALAIAHVQAVRQAQERLARLQALREIDQAILRELDLEAIVHIVLEKVPPSLGADAIALSLLDEDTGDLEVFAMRLPNGTVLSEPVFGVVDALRWFMRHQKPLVIHDLIQDPRVQSFRELVRMHGLVSYLGVPLQVGRQIIGVLHVLTTRPRVFADEDLAFFTTLAGQAAIAIANARLLQDLESRAQAVETLLRSVMSSEDLLAEGALERHLLRTWRDALGVMGVEFFRLDPLAGRLQLTHREGFEGPSLEFPIGEEKGLIGWIAHTRKPLYLPDCAADSRWVSVAPEVRSAYIVPIVWGDTLLGVVSFLGARPHAFPNSRQRLIDLFVQHGAAWLENARFLREAKSHAALLDILQEVATELEGAQTEAEVTDVIGRGTKRLCRPEKIALFLRENGKVRCAWFEGFSADFVEDLVSSAWELPNGHVLRDGRPLLITDIHHLPSDSSIRTWAERGGYRAFSLLPLIYEEQTLGYLACYWDHPYAPPAYEREVMETFARLAATALHSASLYEMLVHTNAALEDALQMRDDMIRNVSHELRTPLTAIWGYLEMFLDGIMGDLTPEQVRAVKVMYRNAERLRFMVERLLTLQSLHARELRREAIPVSSWLDNVAAHWYPQFREKNMSLVLEIQEGIPPLSGERALLEQVMDNLIHNALKFSPEGGTVRVRAWMEGEEIFISVADEGVGLPPEKVNRIFEKFYQVDPSPTRRFEGMGIGLALCKEIIERHGGRIWAESEGEGKGTTVTFALAAHRE